MHFMTNRTYSRPLRLLNHFMRKVDCRAHTSLALRPKRPAQPPQPLFQTGPPQRIETQASASQKSNEPTMTAIDSRAPCASMRTGFPRTSTWLSSRRRTIRIGTHGVECGSDHAVSAMTDTGLSGRRSLVIELDPYHPVRRFFKAKSFGFAGQSGLRRASSVAQHRAQANPIKSTRSGRRAVVVPHPESPKPAATREGVC